MLNSIQYKKNMKTYLRTAKVSLLIAVMLVGSCTNNFEEINNDPNRASDVQPTGILTQAQRWIAYDYYDSWQGLRMNGVISQAWVQRTYTEEDRYDFSARLGTIANFFNLTYRISELLNQIIAINESNPDADGFGETNMQIASVRILKAWLMFQNVQTYGDVPYTEANDVFTYPTPKYDKQDFIYKDLIRELKECNTMLQGVSRGWTSGDVILNGSPEGWRRFANSLRLRIAMRISNADPSFSSTEAAAAIADGVMESNAHNAVFRFRGAGSPNESSKYNTFLSRMDFIPSWQFVNLLHGRDDDNIGFKNPFNGIVDPRFIQFVLSPAAQAAGVDPPIYSPPIGLSGGDNDNVWAILGPASDDDPDLRISYGPTAGQSDNSLPRIVQASMWSTFMDYPNTAFLISEHLGNDRGYFKSAIEASMEMWAVPEDDASDYVDAILAKFDAAATDEEKFEMLITQKYIHNFAHFDQECLFEYRRTEYPKSIVMPGQQTGGEFEIAGETVTFKFVPLPTAHASTFLHRHMYPNTEASFNKESLQEAITSMGGDTQLIKLYYAKK